jgi:hypothetical protein
MLTRDPLGGRQAFIRHWVINSLKFKENRIKTGMPTDVVFSRSWRTGRSTRGDRGGGARPASSLTIEFGFGSPVKQQIVGAQKKRAAPKDGSLILLRRCSPYSAEGIALISGMLNIVSSGTTS